MGKNKTRLQQRLFEQSNSTIYIELRAPKYSFRAVHVQVLFTKRQVTLKTNSACIKYICNFIKKKLHAKKLLKVAQRKTNLYTKQNLLSQVFAVHMQEQFCAWLIFVNIGHFTIQK